MRGAVWHWLVLRVNVHKMKVLPHYLIYNIECFSMKKTILTMRTHTHCAAVQCKHFVPFLDFHTVCYCFCFFISSCKIRMRKNVNNWPSTGKNQVYCVHTVTSTNTYIRSTRLHTNTLKYSIFILKLCKQMFQSRHIYSILNKCK